VPGQAECGTCLNYHFRVQSFSFIMASFYDSLWLSLKTRSFDRLKLIPREPKVEQKEISTSTSKVAPKPWTRKAATKTVDCGSVPRSFPIYGTAVRFGQSINTKGKAPLWDPSLPRNCSQTINCDVTLAEAIRTPERWHTSTCNSRINPTR
jgi:hypothetical protein